MSDHFEWQRLPGWFETNRVQHHTRLQSKKVLDAAFYTAEDNLRGYGFTSALVRWVKSRNDGPYWPTAWPATNPPPGEAWYDTHVGSVDTAGANILRAHTPHAGGPAPMKEVAYYYMMSESNILSTWPSWACRDISSNLVVNNSSAADTWYFLCQNSPFRQQVTRGRLTELASKQPDGIYFDEKHNAPDGCWCSWCAPKFAELYGSLPANNTYNTPQWINLLNYYASICREAHGNYQTAIHAASPDTVAIISAPFTFSMWDPRSASSYAGSLQSPKYELSSALGMYNGYVINTLANYLTASNRPSIACFSPCGWALVRDAANGRMPHIWIDNDPGQHNDTTNYPKTATELVVASSYFLSLGCIANVDINEADKLGDRFGPKLAGARPLRWGGIHFSDRARDDIYRANTTGALTLGRAKGWSNLISTVVFAYEALQLTQPLLPASLVTDSQLERGEIEDLQFLFLPSTNLSPAAAFAVSNYIAAGGTVIRQADHPEWNWKDVVTRTNAAVGLRAAIGAATNAPVKVQGGLNAGAPRIFSTVFQQTNALGNRWLVSVCNDFSWLLNTNIPNATKTNYNSLPPGLPAGGWPA